MSRTRRGVRRLGSPELEAARVFGGQLFEAVFAGEVRGCLRSSLDAAPANVAACVCACVAGSA